MLGARRLPDAVFAKAAATRSMELTLSIRFVLNADGAVSMQNSHRVLGVHRVRILTAYSARGMVSTVTQYDAQRGGDVPGFPEPSRVRG